MSDMIFLCNVRGIIPKRHDVLFMPLHCVQAPKGDVPVNRFQAGLQLFEGAAVYPGYRCVPQGAQPVSAVSAHEEGDPGQGTVCCETMPFCCILFTGSCGGVQDVCPHSS